MIMLESERWSVFVTCLIFFFKFAATQAPDSPEQPAEQPVAISTNSVLTRQRSREMCIYFLTTSRAQSYIEAVSQCTNRGEGNVLAILDTAALRRFASRQIGMLNDSQNHNFYVGAQRMNGQWRWADGSRLDDALITGSGGDCAVVQPFGTLLSVSCFSPHGTLCERMGQNRQSACLTSPCRNNGTCVPVGCNRRCDCSNNFVGEDCSTRVLNISSQRSIQAYPSDDVMLSYRVNSQFNGIIQCVFSQDGTNLKTENFQQNGRFDYDVTNIIDSRFRFACLITMNGRVHTSTFLTTLTLIRPLNRTRSMDNCTYVFTTARAQSYNEAVSQCTNRGEGNVLAILDTAALRRFASRQIGMLNDSQNHNFYVGAQRMNGQWRWADGSRLDDDDINGNNGNCSVIRPNRNLLSVACSSTHGIICERIRRNSQSACVTSTCRNNGTCVPVGCNRRCDCSNNFVGEDCSTRILTITSQSPIQAASDDDLTLMYNVNSSIPGSVECNLNRDGFASRKRNFQLNGEELLMYPVTNISDSRFRLVCTITVNGRVHRSIFRTTLTLIRELRNRRNNCAYLFTTRRLTNEEAKAYCEDNNRILAVLKTPEQRAFASSLINGNRLRGTGAISYFVGAERSNGWRWNDGSALRPAPPGNGDCAVISASSTIEARECSTRNGVICERIAPRSPHACAILPCFNQATCVDVGCGFQCQCADNFMGDTCITKILNVTARSTTLQVVIGDNVELVYEVAASIPVRVQCTLRRGATGPSRRQVSFDTSMMVTETISNIRTSGTYNLACFIMRNERRISQTSQIVVNAVRVPPNITLPTSPAEYLQGSNVTVRCIATGRPLPTVSWMREDTNEPPPQSNMTFDGRVVAVLEMMNVKFNDSGTYICKADGATRTIEIKIFGPPVVHQSTQYVAPIINNMVKFTCTFEGFPPPRITWQFIGEGNLPQDHSQFVIGELEKLSEYRNSRSLTMYGVDCKGTSLIGVVCRARNKHSDGPVMSRPFYADIPTSSLNFLQPARSCAESVTSCQDEGGALVVVPSHAVMLNINAMAGGGYWVSSNTTRYYTRWASDSDRQPNPDGCLRVARRADGRPAVFGRNQDNNAFGVCEERFAAQSMVTSKENKCDGTRLMISWKIIEGAASLPHRILVDGKDHMETGPGVDAAQLTGLEPSTTYRVQVFPLFRDCTSPKLRGARSFSTGRENLPPPNNVMSRFMLNQSRCVVTWTYESTLSSEISYFNVSVQISIHLSSRDAKPLGEPDYAVVEKQNTRHIIANLRPNTIYHVSVAAVATANCPGKIPNAWSAVVTDCTTPPRAPRRVRLSATRPQPSSDGAILTLDRTNQRNGPVSCIAVVVQKVVDDGSPAVIKNLTTLSVENEDDSDPYIAWVSQSLDKEMKLSLGSGNVTCCDITSLDAVPDCSSSTRRRKRQVSSPLIRGENRGLLNANYTYYIITSTLTENGPMFANSNASEPFVANKTPIDSNDSVVVIVIVIILIIVLIVLILVVLYKKKKCCFKRKTASVNGHVMQPVVTVPTPNITDNASFDGESDEGRINEESHPPQFTNYHLPGDVIMATYLNKRSNKDRLFEKEFKVTLPAIIKSQGIVITTARLPENTTKNRYKNILPCEHSRVRLSKIEGVPGSDYINAAYIDGYHHSNKFIAAQGPKANTVIDFWRMIVEQRCSVIAMATLVKEGYKVKCEKYWPDVNETKTYGDVTVTGKNLVSYGEFQCSIINLQSNAEDASWEIFHFQYLNWPDHGIPGTTSTVLRFYEAACSAQPNSAGPMVIHCSAGVGRTGTLIALGILMDQLANEGGVNVFETVHNMRLNRCDMVQNLGQYIFIHKLLAEVYMYNRTDVEASAFIAYEEQQRRYDPSLGVSGMENQFNQLDKVPPSFEEQTSASKPANKDGHTDASVLPYDYNLAFVGMASNDVEVPFINASNVQTYYAEYFMITAQNPKTSNIHLFWRCILDNEINCVVMIEGKEKMAKYWSESGKAITFHDVTVRTIDETDCAGYMERNLEVTKDGEKNSHKILQLVIKNWPDDRVPESSSALLQIVSVIEKLTPNATDVRGKKFLAMVHCRDGSNQAGTLCAVYNLIERVKNENMVDVFRSVKDLRDMRPKAVGHLRQYELCYSLVREFLESFDLYGNFK